MPVVYYNLFCLLAVWLPFISPAVWSLQVWSLKVEQEEQKNKALTEALQTLATEHYELKQSLSRSRRSSALCTLTEDDFYDAISGRQPQSRLSISQTAFLLQPFL